LFAVYPEEVKPLAVMALHKALLSSIRLYPDCDVAEGCLSEDLLGFCRSEKGDDE
jgi:hypothetical protein